MPETRIGILDKHILFMKQVMHLKLFIFLCLEAVKFLFIYLFNFVGHFVGLLTIL